MIHNSQDNFRISRIGALPIIFCFPSFAMNLEILNEVNIPSLFLVLHFLNTLERILKEKEKNRLSVALRLNFPYKNYNKKKENMK